MIEKITEFENKYPKIAEIIRFLVVGIIATLVDMFVMSLIMYFPNMAVYGKYLNVFFQKGVASTWLSVLATGIGFIVGLVINYLMSIWFVYDGENKKAKTKKGLVLFSILSAIGLLIQTLGMWFFCDLFNLNEWIIKAILVVVVLIFNYVTRKIFIFNEQRLTSVNKNLNIAPENDIDKPNSEEVVAKRDEFADFGYKCLKSNHIKNIRLILNLCFIVSSVIFPFCVFRDLPLSLTFTRIIKFGLAFVLAVLMAFYLFLINKNFVLKNVIYKKQNKFISVKDIITMSLSLIATVCFSYILFIKMSNSIAVKLCLILISSFSIYVFFSAFYNVFLNKLITFVKSLTKSEKIFILISAVISLVLFVVTFCSSALFIGAVKDVHFEIYSFDVGYVMSSYYGNAFVDPFSTLNNIRHLLFSYCVMPFTVIFYVGLKIVGMQALFGCVIQILNYFMIVTVIILLKRMIKIDNIYTEIAFYFLTFLSATMLINMIVAEKFVFAMFYATLCLYATFNKKNTKYLYFFLAVSTLSTFIFLFPIVFFDKEKNAKQIFKELIVFAVFFAFAIILTGEIGIIFSKEDNMNSLLTRFGGSGIKQNLICYFSMFSQFLLFTKPKSFYGIWYEDFTLSSPFFWLGVVICVITIISLFVNRKEKIAHACFYWFIIITIFVVFVGWGVKLNEVFISSTSYFWAILIPIFMLLNKIFKNKKLLLTCVSVVMSIITIWNLTILIEVIKMAHAISPAVFLI